MRGVAVWSVIAAWVLDACSCIESESLAVSNWLRKPSYVERCSMVQFDILH